MGIKSKIIIENNENISRLKLKIYEAMPKEIPGEFHHSVLKLNVRADQHLIEKIENSIWEILNGTKA